MNRDVRKFLDLALLSQAVAKNVCDLTKEIVGTKGIFKFALSGGNTPRTLYRILATSYREAIPWEQIQIFFADERYVPHDDKQSNFRMAKEILFDPVSIPAANIHPIPTSLQYPDEAARAYEKELRRYFPDGGNAFDLVLLGMGKEGHTASLFPNSPALDDKNRWTAAVDVPAIPANRITLTYPILNRSSLVYFLVSGTEKREAFKKVTGGTCEFHDCPAAGVSPVNGKVTWWMDSAVAMD